MSQIIPFRRRLREEIRRQACIWLVEIDAGLSTEDQERLAQWLAERPEHVKTLLEVASIWDRLSVLSELSRLFPLKQFALEQDESVSAHSGAFGKRFATGIAIVLMVVVTGIVSLTLKDTRSVGETVAFGPQMYETAVGEQLSMPLPDGSGVVLNTNTLIEVLYTPEERSIVLERGEAHFTVASNAERPFRVRAGSNVVEALGTAFAVHRTDEGTEVTVTEGKVSLLRFVDLPAVVPSSLEAADQSVVAESRRELEVASILSNGEHATMLRQGNDLQKEQMRREEIEARLAWRHGMLLFQGDPLEKVLREVSRYTTTKIEADAAIRDIPVVGYFRAGDIDRLLVAMQENFHLQVERTANDHILLTSRADPQ